MAQPREQRIGIGLQAALLWATAGLVAVTVLAIATLAFWESGPALERTAHAHLEAVSVATEARVESHLTAGPEVLGAAESIIRRGLLSHDDQDGLAEHMVEQIALHPDLGWLGFADAMGQSYSGATRHEDGRLIHYIADARVNGAVPRRLAIDAEGNRQRLPPDAPYVVGARPWFIDALEHEEDHRWGEPYTFGDGSLGITVTQVVRAPDGTMLGVLAADIFLRDLERFLVETSAPGNGFVLLSAGDALVGVPTDERAAVAEAVRIHIAQDGAGERLVMPDQVWRVTTVPIPIAELSTQVITVVPESVLTGALTASMRAVAITGLLILLLAMAVAFVFSRRLATPITEASDMIAGLARMDFGELRPQLTESPVQEINRLQDASRRLRLLLRTLVHEMPEVGRIFKPHSSPTAALETLPALRRMVDAGRLSADARLRIGTMLEDIDRPASSVAIGELWGRFVSYADTPPELKTAFRRHCAEVTTVAGIILGVGCMLSALVFWPTDYFFFADNPSIIAGFFWVRMGVVVGATTLLVPLFLVPAAQERSPAVVSVCFVATGMWSAYWFGSIGGLDAPWFSVTYACTPLTVVILLPFWSRLTVTVAFAGLWSVVFFGMHPQHTHTPHLMGVLAFQAFVAVFSTGMGHVLYHLLRRSFLQGLRLEEQQRALTVEQEKSERLLLNVLPASVAERLKKGEQPIADRFENVTVLFADMSGFTELSQTLEPAELVGMLNEVFSAFDAMAEERGLEKIKTIGDAYMAAAGLPEPRADHADAAVQLGLDMLAHLATLEPVNGVKLRMRVGVHTGPVMAGVIGIHKFIYDVWGDTVNTASRMESHGVPGRLQITRATLDELGGGLRPEPRGTILVKGKGEMETWLLGGEG